jgi:hypothetical protein
MRAYILTDNKCQIFDRDQLDLFDGYQELCYNIKFFKEQDLLFNNIKINKEDIFCGHVNLCLTILKRNNIPVPKSLDYPDELKEYFGRKIRKSTLNEFDKLLKDNEELGNIYEYFIKPIRNKLFTGFKCNNRQDLWNKTAQSAQTLPESTEIYVSSIVNFLDEYRVYVYQNQIIQVCPYWQESWKLKIPDYTRIEEMVAKMINPPIFYSIDVGITDKNETLLVEVNDGYALGNYGLPVKIYAEASSSRWLQINS